MKLLANEDLVNKVTLSSFLLCVIVKRIGCNYTFYTIVQESFWCYYFILIWKCWKMQPISLYTFYHIMLRLTCTWRFFFHFTKRAHCYLSYIYHNFCNVVLVEVHGVTISNWYKTLFWYNIVFIDLPNIKLILLFRNSKKTVLKIDLYLDSTR